MEEPKVEDDDVMAKKMWMRAISARQCFVERTVKYLKYYKILFPSVPLLQLNIIEYKSIQERD